MKTPTKPIWGRIWPDGQMRQPANPDFQVWFDNIFLVSPNGRPDIDCSFKRVVFLSYRISWIAAETEHIAKEKTI